jgi:sugar lactone lactonase YvrE
VDQSSFDRLARLLARTTTRRLGLAGAFGAALGLPLISDAETRNDRNGGRNRGTTAGKGRGKRTPGSEGPCGDGSRRDNACTNDRQCCTGVCKTGLKNRDGMGRCRCMKRGKPCTADSNCCNGLTCHDGACARGGPTPPACDAATCPAGCCDGATCVPYASQTTNLCGASGAACAACATDNTCVSGVCEPATFSPVVTGFSGPVGVATDNVKVYIANQTSKLIQSFAMDGSGLQAGSAVTQQTNGLAFNPVDGKLYVALYEQGQIREVDVSTLEIASSSWAQGLSNSAFGLAFDANGDAWVSALAGSANSIYRVSQGASSPSPVLSNVCPTSAPFGLTFGTGGLLYVSCTALDQVIAIDPSGPTKLNSVLSVSSGFGLAFEGSTMYVSRFDDSKIDRYTVQVVNGEPVYTLEETFDTPTPGAKPCYMAIDTTGKVWIAAFQANTVYGATLASN